MSERTKFLFLLVLLGASIILLWHLEQNAQDILVH